MWLMVVMVLGLGNFQFRGMGDHDWNPDEGLTGHVMFTRGARRSPGARSSETLQQAIRVWGSYTDDARLGLATNNWIAFHSLPDSYERRF